MCKVAELQIPMFKAAGVQVPVCKAAGLQPATSFGYLSAMFAGYDGYEFMQLVIAKHCIIALWRKKMLSGLKKFGALAGKSRCKIYFLQGKAPNPKIDRVY